MTITLVRRPVLKNIVDHDGHLVNHIRYRVGRSSLDGVWVTDAGSLSWENQCWLIDKERRENYGPWYQCTTRSHWGL